MRANHTGILLLLSDVDFSPQLFAIIEKVLECGARVRVVMIGDEEMQIVKQINSRGWNYRVIHKHGKILSILTLMILIIENVRFRPNVLFASGQFATVLGMVSSKLCGIDARIFIRHHSNFHHKYKKKIGLFFDLLSNRLATKIVSVSKVVRDILVLKEFVDISKVELIHNGVDLRNFRRMDSERRIQATGLVERTEQFHVGVISRLTEWKGVEYSAQAFVRLAERYPNVRLHVVGAFADSHSGVSNLLSTIDEKMYTLEKSHADIPNFFRSIDVFVHVPVGKDDEAFGIVYIEALAMGVPCIFTQSGVMNELESLDQFVELVDFENSDQIFIKLEEMINGTNEPKSPIPKEWVDQFSIEHMATRYADLLLGEDKK